MPVVPVLPSVTGGVYTTSQLSAVVSAVAFLQKPPIARLRTTAVSSVTTAVYTTVALQAEDVDSDVDGVGGHDNVTNNTRYTARYPGWYSVSAQTGLWASNATGRRGVRFMVSGTIVVASKILVPSAVASGLDIPTQRDLVFMAIGDYFETQILQESGGALNFGSATAEDNCTITIKWESN